MRVEQSRFVLCITSQGVFTQAVLNPPTVQQASEYFLEPFCARQLVTISGSRAYLVYRDLRIKHTEANEIGNRSTWRVTSCRTEHFQTNEQLIHYKYVNRLDL